MPNWAIYDTNTNDVKKYLISDPNDPTYPVGVNEGSLKDPDTTEVAGQPIRYWKHVDGSLQLKTAGEQASADSALAAALLSSQRAGAKEIFDGDSPNSKILKAIVLLLIDELNVLRERDRDRAVDVAAATNLANLKTRWAAQSSLADRTAAQAKTAIEAKINAGNAD